MTNSHDDRLRTALLSLGTGPAEHGDEIPLPPLFRAPVIALLWIALAITIVGLLTLSRIRVPRLVHGVAVAVESGADSVSMLLLLPRAVEPHVRAGQHASVDVGGGRSIVLDLASVDTVPLDAASARRRFRGTPHVLGHLDQPKVAAALAQCSPDHTCLTPTPGAVFQATASLGTRTLASYAWSSTPAITP